MLVSEIIRSFDAIGGLWWIYTPQLTERVQICCCCCSCSIVDIGSFLRRYFKKQGFSQTFLNSDHCEYSVVVNREEQIIFYSLL